MYLHVDDSKKEYLEYSPSGMIIGYVLINHRGVSVYRRMRYKVGVNRAGVTLYFIDTKMIHEGLHFFMKKEDALAGCMRCEKVIKCYIKPKDMLAVGYFMNAPSFAATECRVYTLKGVTR